MKKITSTLLALSMIICAVSCEKKAENSTPANTPIQGSLVSFKSADILMADDFSQLICTDRRSAYYLIFGMTGSGEYCGYVTNTQFAEKKSFTFTARDGEDIKCAAMMPAGKAAVLSVMGSSTIIRTFGTNMEQENEYDLGEVISPDDHFAELLCTDDGFYINIARHDVGYVDKEGNYKGEISTGGRTICGIINDNSGTPCALMSERTKMSIGSLGEGKIGEISGCGELADYVDTICTGEGDYRIAVTINDGLYVLREDGWVKLTDFSDNDFRVHEIRDIDMTAADEFAVMLIRENGTCGMRLLSQRDISEIRQKKIIRMANTVGGNIDPYDDQIKKYNSENEEYKIELVSYTVDNMGADFDGLKRDMISGNAPDIIRFNRNIPVTSFGSAESIFVDMYELMDNDSDLKRGDFLDGFLEAQETKGKLLQMYPTFNIHSIMIKDKFANGLTSWDYDEFETAYRNIPQDMDFNFYSYWTKDEMFNELIDHRQFIDFKNAECHFTSPEFIRAIKLINDNNIGLSVAASEAAREDSWANEEILAFRNDKVLVNSVIVNSFRDIKLYDRIYSGEPCTFIGSPSENGVGSYSSVLEGFGIMANSDVIDVAWDFLKYYLFNESGRFTNGLSGLRERFDAQLEYESTPHTETDPETGEVYNMDVYAVYEDGNDEPTRMEMSAFTAEEAAKYREFALTALQHPIASDNNIKSILDEELTAYFEGERSAEEAAEIIQNRVSIYLSENS